ncbi:MAG TPA: tetratricopeptide repeat protein [Isosphaeraceae bacterium]|jgi:tetratricopeptide (TPR) repeat protein|nr:tetratricopeptide repeat protein [Isosphaeraceae bacterium]
MGARTRFGIGVAAAVAGLATATAEAQVIVPPMMGPPPPSFLVIRNRWGPPIVLLPPPPPVVIVPRMVPPQSTAPQGRPAVEPKPRPVPRDKAKAARLVTLGDRLLKVGNLKRAEERYSQALRADGRATAPMVGLAQIAIIRGDYAEAADHFRVAQAADPDWLKNNPRDVESMFQEPSAFHKQIAGLEAHLQAEPEDRDAWFVLGTEWLLSGRAERASNVFLRLSDRKDDRVVAAFLAAADTKAAEARSRGD